MKNNLTVKLHNCQKVHIRPRKEDPFARCVRHITADIVSQRRMARPSPAGGESILLAENDRFLRMLMRNVLYGAGYRILEAFNTEDAVHKFRNYPEGIDLLLLDLDMPRKNGTDVYDEIRKLNPEVKVVFASAYPSEIMRLRRDIDGSNHVLAKPFGPTLLLKKIREVLDERSSILK